MAAKKVIQQGYRAFYVKKDGRGRIQVFFEYDENGLVRNAHFRFRSFDLYPNALGIQIHSMGVIVSCGNGVDRVILAELPGVEVPVEAMNDRHAVLEMLARAVSPLYAKEVVLAETDFDLQISSVPVQAQN